MANKKVRGNIFLNYMAGEKDRVIYLEIPKETYDNFAKEIDTKVDNPLKIGFDDTEGKFFFKAKSAFDIGVYQDADISGIDVSEIGQGSEVVLDVKIVEGKYKNKKYFSAYLKNINILSYNEAQPYNPFLD